MSLCMLFNTNYSTEGWVTVYTFKKLHPDVNVYILCMDDEVYRQANKLKDKVIPIHVKELEAYWPKLHATKKSRALREYIVSFKPFLPEYIFKNFNEDRAVFVDADIVFWREADEMFNLLDNCSFFAKDHEIEPTRPAGRFNVGVLGFKNDERCQKWLTWWQEKCLEWCFWRAENGKFAEQGYLTILHTKPNLFKGFMSVEHPGVNLAPWNIMKHRISSKDNKLYVDNRKLITYHYHEFALRDNSYFPTGWKLPPKAKSLLYDPYFNLIRKSNAGKLWG